MTALPAVPSASSASAASPQPSAVLRREPAGTEWRRQVSWLTGAALLGFAVPALLAGALGLPREMMVLGYLAVVGPFLYGYARANDVDALAETRRRWPWGVVAAAAIAAFTVSNVLGQPASAVPTGIKLVLALLWLGVVYGALDALFLSVLPVYATWRALASLGWTRGWTGRIAAGAVALAASALLTVVYHAGYPEYRGAAMVGPVIGNLSFTLGYLASTNPLGAVLSHVAMHTAGVLRGMETVVQLPPHYP